MSEEVDLSKWIRVSSVLGLMPSMGSDGLWEYPMQKIDSGVLQRKAELGTSVHSAIAAHVKNEFYVVTDKEEGYLNSYLKWEKSVNLLCHEVEKRFFYEPMNLTGCVDMIGKINPNDLYHIIDFKCTVSPNHKKWPLQGAFYEFLAKANGITLDKKCLFVQLDPNGDFPKIHEYEITSKMTATAISLYNMYTYLT
jgi:hypothetical protein